MTGVAVRYPSRVNIGPGRPMDGLLPRVLATSLPPKNEAYDGGLDSRFTLPNGTQKVWFQLCWYLGTLGVIFTDNNNNNNIRDRAYNTAATAEVSRGGQLAAQLNSTRFFSSLALSY